MKDSRMGKSMARALALAAVACMEMPGASSYPAPKGVRRKTPDDTKQDAAQAKLLGTNTGVNQHGQTNTRNSGTAVPANSYAAKANPNSPKGWYRRTGVDGR